MRVVPNGRIVIADWSHTASFWWFSKPFGAVNRVGMGKTPSPQSQNGRSMIPFGEVAVDETGFGALLVAESGSGRGTLSAGARGIWIFIALP